MQGSLTLRTLRVHLGSGRQQDFYHLAETVPARLLQHCHAVPLRVGFPHGLQLCSCTQQGAHHLGVILFRGDVQTVRSEVGFALQQRPHSTRMTTIDGQVQRSSVSFAMRIGVLSIT
eukprot:Skav223046  [mRNA]  locus=scaffold1069:239790:244064:- [translate_table: standard]